MPLYEYECKECHTTFEQITSYSQRKDTACPKCSSKNINFLVPLFQVRGRGDLRESTMHGCHIAHPALDEEGGTGEDHPSASGSHAHSHKNWVHDALMGGNPKPDKAEKPKKKEKGRFKHGKN